MSDYPWNEKNNSSAHFTVPLRFFAGVPWS